MNAIICDGYGAPDVLKIGQCPVPSPTEQQVLIQCSACGVNRADCLQRQGRYPPPPGSSELLGLEVSGVVVAPANSSLLGKEVMALVSGGAYSAFCVANTEHVICIPKGIYIISAGGIPETWLTAFQLLKFVCSIKKDDYVLIHAAASGVGTSAIQLCLLFGARPIAVSSTAEKLSLCTKLGAVGTVNYTEIPDFSSTVLDLTGGAGANIILDPVGASIADTNVKCLAHEGNWIIFGFLGGQILNNFNVSLLFRKCGHIHTSYLRGRDDTYKSELIAAFRETILPHFVTGSIAPIIDKVYPLSKAAEAHQYMESNKTLGKIILKYDLN